MWIFILLVHLFALGYVLSGQSCSQYTDTVTDAIGQELARVGQRLSETASAPSPHLTVTSWTNRTTFQLQAPLVRDGSTRGGDWDACLLHEAREAGVHPSLLRAMVHVESGGRPYTFGWPDQLGVRQQYHTTNYVQALRQFHSLHAQGIRFDVGLIQVNSQNLSVLHARTGIAPTRALDACDNLKLGGYILREKIRQHGSTWQAIAGYNGIGSQTYVYAHKVRIAYCHRSTWDPFCRKTTPIRALLHSPLPVHPPSLREEMATRVS